MASPFFKLLLDRLTPEARERYEATQEWYARDVAEAREFTDTELVRKVRYYMANSTQVQKWAPGEVVYDAALWHVLVPELLKRLVETAPPCEHPQELQHHYADNGSSSGGCVYWCPRCGAISCTPDRSTRKWKLPPFTDED